MFQYKQLTFQVREWVKKHSLKKMKINWSTFSILGKSEKTGRIANMYFHERVIRELLILYITRLDGDCFCYIPFSLLRRSYQQNFTLDRCHVLGYFQRKHCKSLMKSYFWTYQTIIIIMIITIIIIIIITIIKIMIIIIIIILF